MSRDTSVAPKERINIKYVPATGDQQEDVELPLRLVVLGDFTGRTDETSIEERSMLSVDKTTYNTVLAEAGLERNFVVSNTLIGDEDAELNVDLKIKSLKDFEPDSVVQQVPELKKLVDLRDALVALKGPLGNMPSFRKRLELLLKDEESRKRLLGELEAIEAERESAPEPQSSSKTKGSKNGEIPEEEGS